MVRNFYPEILEGLPLHDEAVAVGKRVFEFGEFLVKVAKTLDVGATFPHRVTFHDACHGLRELHLKEGPRELLRNVRELELVEMPYSEDCCGFGGTFATKYGMISAAMGEAKAASAATVKAEYLVSGDPSCLMHIDGILRKQGSTVKMIHLASILAKTADRAAASESRGAAAEGPSR